MSSKFGLRFLIPALAACIFALNGIDFSYAQQVAFPIPYKGIKVNQERLSLDLKGIDINELLRILSVKMGVTIVPTRSVNGRVNIFLNNLTFNDALDVILISQDLAMDRQGNIINIMTATDYERLYGKKYNEKRKFSSYKLSYAKPATVLAALAQVKSDIGKVIIDEASGTVLIIDTPERLELLEKTIKELDTALVTKVFNLGYMNSVDAKAQLTAALTPTIGEVLVDERSHKAIVTDLPGNMKEIEKIAAAFDEEAREVTLVVEMVEITINDEYQRQVNWEKLLAQKSWDGMDIKGVFPVAASFTPQVAITQDDMKVTVGTLAQRRYTATLDLLSTLGEVKIISRQSVVAVSNTEAKLRFVEKQPFTMQTINGTGATTTISDQIEFFDVGVSLNIIPLVNKDGVITMKISPNLTSIREIIVTEYSNIPILEESESFTSVAVKSGQTVMIAGMQYREFKDQIAGIPELSKTPFSGTRSIRNKTKEVVVFVTPFVS